MASSLSSLVRWKLLLTWRLYTRNTLASIETLLFFLVFSIWIIFWTLGLYYASDWISGIPETPRALAYSDLFSFILILWLVMALAGYRLNEGYDLDRLRMYPLNIGTIFLSSLLAPLTDLSALLPLSGMMAIFLGTHPSPAQLPVGILLILALVFFVISSGSTLVNLLYAFIPKLNLVKVGVTVLILTLAWAVFLNLGLVQYPMHAFFLLFRPIGLELFKAYPSGQIGIALDAYQKGNLIDMNAPMLGFELWTAGVLLLDFLLTAYIWTNDVGARGSKLKFSKSDLSGKFLDGIESIIGPWVGPEAFALFRKDMLDDAFRSPYFLIYKMLPGSIAPVIILLAMRWNLENIVKFSTHPHAFEIATTATIMLVLFIVVAQGNLFAGNQFGLEDTAIKNLMVMPTPRRSLLIGKNLFLGCLFLVDSVVLSLMILLYFPTAFHLFALLSLTITLFLLILSIGNFTSAIWPYWMPLDKPSFTLRTTVILGFVNMIVTIILAIGMSIPIALVLIPHRFHADWFSYIMMIASVLYGAFIYKYTLKPAVSLMESNEFLMLNRIGDRETL